MRQPLERRRAALAALAALVGAVLLAGVGALMTGDLDVERLDAPAAGEARATSLEDGTPVLVTNDGESLHVLDARDAGEDVGLASGPAPADASGTDASGAEGEGKEPDAPAERRLVGACRDEGVTVLRTERGGALWDLDGHPVARELQTPTEEPGDDDQQRPTLARLGSGDAEDEQVMVGAREASEEVTPRPLRATDVDPRGACLDPDADVALPPLPGTPAEVAALEGEPSGLVRLDALLEVAEGAARLCDRPDAVPSATALGDERLALAAPQAWGLPACDDRPSLDWAADHLLGADDVALRVGELAVTLAEGEPTELLWGAESTDPATVAIDGEAVARGLSSPSPRSQLGEQLPQLTSLNLPEDVELADDQPGEAVPDPEPDLWLLDATISVEGTGDEDIARSSHSGQLPLWLADDATVDLPGADPSDAAGDLPVGALDGVEEVEARIDRATGETRELTEAAP